MNNVRNMWRFIYTVQHLGMFYCRCSSISLQALSVVFATVAGAALVFLIFSLPASAFTHTLAPLLLSLLNSLHCSYGCKFHGSNFSCRSIWLVLLRFLSSIPYRTTVHTHTHTHSHTGTCHSFHFRFRFRFPAPYTYVLCLFYLGYYYCYCYSSFVIWSRAKYWIHHKWYYFICCVCSARQSHPTACYWDVWTECVFPDKWMQYSKRLFINRLKLYKRMYLCKCVFGASVRLRLALSWLTIIRSSHLPANTFAAKSHTYVYRKFLPGDTTKQAGD